MVDRDLEYYQDCGSARDARHRRRRFGKYQDNSATDAYGIAEPANIATRPAIANALYNAFFE